MLLKIWKGHNRIYFRGMQRDISEKEFETLSKEKKKQYVAKLVIKISKATPVNPTTPPIAIIMAGLPGAGKTEFLDTLDELLDKNGSFSPFVRIDLDQIVTVYPKYTPQSYDKFRSQGNYALARCIDVAREGRYNMMVDGTFAGSSDASIKNIERLLSAGYIVSMYYMHDNPETAWGYTLSREIETNRGIDKDGFLSSCQNISTNLKKAVSQFSQNKNFSFCVVLQKKLRDKNYKLINNSEDVDTIINKGYNIDRLRKIL